MLGACCLGSCEVLPLPPDHLTSAPVQPPSYLALAWARMRGGGGERQGGGVAAGLGWEWEWRPDLASWCPEARLPSVACRGALLKLRKREGSVFKTKTCGSSPSVILLLKSRGDVGILDQLFSADPEMPLRSIAGPALQALCPTHIFFRLAGFCFPFLHCGCFICLS